MTMGTPIRIARAGARLYFVCFFLFIFIGGGTHKFIIIIINLSYIVQKYIKYKTTGTGTSTWDVGRGEKYVTVVIVDGGAYGRARVSRARGTRRAHPSRSAGPSPHGISCTRTRVRQQVGRGR